MAASQLKIVTSSSSNGSVAKGLVGASKPLAGLSSLLTPPESPIASRTGHQQQQQTRAKSARIAMGRHLCVSEPVPWHEVKAAIDREDVEPLGRSVEMQTRYQEHVARVKAEYGSVADYLTQHALADFIGRGLSADEDANFMFRINDFPYSLGDGVEHWVLWSHRQLTPGFALPEAAVRVIEAKFGRKAERRYFVNPVAKQSVPQLSHAHVFVKREASAELPL
ncbi:hypothetical protein FB645_003921 [Coemansia sp. IMI 203386]|nr:hypothetical protein FB645_003921 [Coemansia sp. IMI 203386]